MRETHRARGRGIERVCVGVWMCACKWVQCAWECACHFNRISSCVSWTNSIEFLHVYRISSCVSNFFMIHKKKFDWIHMKKFDWIHIKKFDFLLLSSDTWRSAISIEFLHLYHEEIHLSNLACQFRNKHRCVPFQWNFFMIHEKKFDWIHMKKFDCLLLSWSRPTQSVMYVPLQVNVFHENILFIVQYKYLKSCSGDFYSPESDPLHEIMRYWFYYSIWLGFSFPPNHAGLLEMICTTVVPVSKGYLGGASP